MNIVATRAAEGLPRRSFTVAEIRRMVEAGIIAEDENFELIEGGACCEISEGKRPRDHQGRTPRRLRAQHSS